METTTATWINPNVSYDVNSTETDANLYDWVDVSSTGMVLVRLMISLPKPSENARISDTLKVSTLTMKRHTRLCARVCIYLCVNIQCDVDACDY